MGLGSSAALPAVNELCPILARGRRDLWPRAYKDRGRATHHHQT